MCVIQVIHTGSVMQVNAGQTKTKSLFGQCHWGCRRHYSNFFSGRLLGYTIGICSEKLTWKSTRKSPFHFIMISASSVNFFKNKIKAENKLGCSYPSKRLVSVSPFPHKTTFLHAKFQKTINLNIISILITSLYFLCNLLE